MSTPRDEDRLLQHRYDDIQEYDNPMPGWWVWILWATVIWAVLYCLNIVPGIGSGKGRVANYQAEMAAAAQKYGASGPKPASGIDVGALLAAGKDPVRLAAGRTTFETTCASCHLKDGGGQIGPNLTDDYWIHGGRPRDILTTITNGVPDKGMPTWSAIMKPEQLAAVAAYVLTLHGTHPAVAKPPQGERYAYEHGEIEDTGVPAPADSASH